jgi:raffinose/stachyose/melibiose transport system permease protein
MITENFKVRTKFKKIFLWILTFIIVVIWVVPFVFMIFTSLKTQSEVQTLPAFALPSVFNWVNYPDAIQRVKLLDAMKNSLTIAIFKVPAGLFISALAAFAIARLKIPRPRLLLALFVLGTMVPIQIALAPLFHMILGMGLLNTKLGVILPYIAFGIPYQVFMFYGFFQAIPMELDEAARMDGASNFRIFWDIILPLAKPAIAALFILDFVATWNEFGMALVLLQDQSTWTVPLAIQGFNTAYATYYGQLNAAVIMSIIPVLIVYLLFQKYFVEGTFAGAIKG